MVKISARTKAHPEPVEVEYDLPDGLQAKITKYGEDVVDNHCEDSMVISIQALMRRLIEKGSSHADIQKAVTEWSPSVRNVIRQTAFEKASTSLDKLTPEERRQLLQKLQSMK